MNPMIVGAIADAAKGSEIGKINVGTGDIDHSKGEGIKVTGAEGNINFGDVKQRFNNIPEAPSQTSLDDEQMSK